MRLLKSLSRFRILYQQCNHTNPGNDVPKAMPHVRHDAVKVLLEAAFNHEIVITLAWCFVQAKGCRLCYVLQGSEMTFALTIQHNTRLPHRTMSGGGNNYLTNELMNGTCIIPLIDLWHVSTGYGEQIVEAILCRSASFMNACERTNTAALPKQDVDIKVKQQNSIHCAPVRLIFRLIGYMADFGPFSTDIAIILQFQRRSLDFFA